MGYSHNLHVLLYFILMFVLFWKATGVHVTVVVRPGDRAIFQLPSPIRCNTSILTDPGGTDIFETSLYGNSLKAWASVRGRTDYIDLGSYINFTIHAVQDRDEGVYTYRPIVSNAANVNCIRQYDLQILKPVNGGWTQWSGFGSCSVSCGGGTHTRNRSCTAPRPQYGGLDCVGSKTDTQTCGTSSCPVNGGWTQWSGFGPCSVSCGGGTHTRHRSCTAPKPQYGGLDCVGSKTDTQTCGISPCPVNGGWTQWSGFGPCSVSCGGGTHTRNRSCTAPRPQYGGLDCVGSKTDTQTCGISPCPVDGGWGTWSDWSSCSQTCGQGTMRRWRSCDNPTPSNGGINCLGSPTDRRECNVQFCPVDGHWSNWSAYGPCSVTCNTGVQFRNRSCSNPAPTLGGHGCVGDSTDEILCNDNPCPASLPAWSEWLNGTCSVSCGLGSMNRTRYCKVDGQTIKRENCTGSGFETEMCKGPPCPIDGSWSQWGNFSSCSKTCGPGMRTRTRNCSEPSPQFGGNTCLGDRKQPELCKTRECGVDGSWSSWSTWTFCPNQCDTDLLQNRTRECDRPVPKYGGLECVGNDTESRPCQRERCESQTSPLKPDSLPLTTIIIIAVAAGIVIIAIVTVAMICSRRKTKKNKNENGRNTTARTDVQMNRVTLFDNPTYNEIESDENNIYSEIPAGEQSDLNAACQLTSFNPQYEQLPGWCGDGEENTYTRMSPENEEQMQKLRAGNTDSYMEPFRNTDSYLTPSCSTGYMKPSRNTDSSYLTPLPKHKVMTDKKDNTSNSDNDTGASAAQDDGYMYITPVFGPSSVSELSSSSNKEMTAYSNNSNEVRCSGDYLVPLKKKTGTNE